MAIVNQLPQASGSGPTPTETLLWTNPNPTANIAGQAVTLSETIKNFTYFKVVYRTSTTGNVVCWTLFPVFREDGETYMYYTGDNQAKAIISFTTSGGTARQRRFYVNNAAGTQIYLTSATNLNSTTTVNNALIPWYIYGIK